MYVRMTHKSVINNIANIFQKRSLNILCQVEQLSHRGLIRVSGKDVTTFLQGIVTNNLTHLQESCKSLFAMFLNTRGRVLYDSIIYKSTEPDTYLLECDCNCLPDLVKHIKMHRVRRKISVDCIDNDWKLWVLFNPREVEDANNNVKQIKKEEVVPCTLPNEGHSTFLNEIILSENASLYSDPRITCLGNRVIAPVDEKVEELVRSTGVQVEKAPSMSYRMFRYRLGVGEGVDELPVGKCFPLEVNCDYLHGVSFHKGCYIGQELTARTHHTGVVRKRLMPLLMHSEPNVQLPMDTPIEVFGENKRTSVGKLRGLEKNTGLGLMRIAEALEKNKFTLGGVECETMRPSWWPQEVSKVKVNSKRS